MIDAQGFELRPVRTTTKPLCLQGFSHVTRRVAAPRVTHLSAKIQAREAHERPLRYGVILAGTVRHEGTWHHGNAVGAKGSSASAGSAARVGVTPIIRAGAAFIPAHLSGELVSHPGPTGGAMGPSRRNPYRHARRGDPQQCRARERHL